MIRGTAVDRQNYYVIRDEEGLYLHISGFRPSGSGQSGPEHTVIAWGLFPAAAQWYQSSPDRVHVFDVEGRFRYAWVAGLDAALGLIQRYGGHLVYIDGSTARPFEPGPPIVGHGRTSWERLLLLEEAHGSV